MGHEQYVEPTQTFPGLLDQSRATRKVVKVDLSGLDLFCTASSQIVGNRRELLRVTRRQQEHSTVGRKGFGGLLGDGGRRPCDQDPRHGAAAAVTRRQNDEEKLGSI